MESNKENIYRAIYKVNHQGGSGTCFFVRSLGYFVTNYHVVEGYHQIAIESAEGDRYPAQVVLANPSLDLALIRAEGDFDGLPDLVMASEGGVAMGEHICVAGYPFGLPFSVTNGTVSSPRQRIDNRYYIQTDAAVNPGNSGGPMFNHKDEVVAVTVSKLNNADNMGFGIPVEHLRSLQTGLASIVPDVFNLQCSGCEEAISTAGRYCPSCGAQIPIHAFEVKPLTNLAIFVENSIERMGISPQTARCGFESWQLYQGNLKVGIYVYNTNFLLLTTRLVSLPKKNVGEVLTYLLSDPTPPYQLGLLDNIVLLYHCVHLNDLNDGDEGEIKDKLSTFPGKATEMAEFLIRNHECLPLPDETQKK